MYKFLFAGVASWLICLQYAPATDSGSTTDSATESSGGAAEKKSGGGDLNPGVESLVENIIREAHKAIYPGNLKDLTVYKTIIERTIAGSKDLQMARSNVAKVQLGKGTARGSLLPDVTVGSSMGAEFSRNDALNEKRTFDGKRIPPQPGIEDDDSPSKSKKTQLSGPSLSVRVAQNVFNGGASFAALKQATFESKAAFAKYKSSEGESLTKMIKLAFDVIHSRLLLHYRQINLAVFKEILKCEFEKLNVGEVDRSEVAVAEGKYAACEANIQLLQAQLSAYEGDLLRFTGLKGEDLPLEFPDFSQFFPKNLNELKNIAERENSGLLAGHFLLQSCKAAIKQARAGHAPVVDVTLSGSTGSSFARQKGARDMNDMPEGYSYARNHARSCSVGIELKVPIDIKGTVSGKISETRQNLIRQTVENQKAHSDLMSELETLHESLMRFTEAANAHKRQVKAYELQVQAVMQEMAVGAKVYTQALTAQGNALDAYKDYVQVLCQLAETRLRILAAIGRLNAQTLDVAALDFREGVPYDFMPETKDVSFKDMNREYDEHCWAQKGRKAAAQKEEPAVVPTKVDVDEQGISTTIYPVRVDMKPILG
ncbi:MAG: TolC family protein [Holosporales bacterium]|nr:TolC family protein [Holosporales bacterium]